jgi:FtsP/CotA-like multicopper oxidase with cupredoxin domain
MINGRETATALTDPYTRVSLGLGQKAYIRLLNVGYQWARVRLGGRPFDVVASDGRPMKKVVTTDAWELGPGERYDLLFSGAQTGTTDATVEYLDDYSGAVLGTAATRIQVI